MNLSFNNLLQSWILLVDKLNNFLEARLKFWIEI